MAYALESSKRKLHRLLDSISSDAEHAIAAEPKSNGTTNKSAPEPPSKRARRGPIRAEGGGLAGALIRNGTASTLRLSAANDAKASGEPTKMVKTPCGDEVIQFAPSSRRDFLLRLKTFSIPTVIRWSTKPAEINEVEWAKRGWVLRALETVVCTSCSSHVEVAYVDPELKHLREGTEPDLENWIELRQQVREDNETAVRKIAPGIIESHVSSCPWRFKGCDETIQRLPVNNPFYALNELKNRFESFLEIADFVPDVSRLPSSDRIDDKELYDIFLKRLYPTNPPEISADQGEPHPIAEPLGASILVLALFGLERDPHGHGRGQAICKACWQRTPFWLYRRGNEAESSEQSIFNVMESHREYCPWINGTTQQSGASLYNYYDEGESCGWEGLYTMLCKEQTPVRPPSSHSQANSNASAASSSAELNLAARQAADKARLGKWQHLKERLQLRGKRLSLVSKDTETGIGTTGAGAP